MEVHVFVLTISLLLLLYSAGMDVLVGAGGCPSLRLRKYGLFVCKPTEFLFVFRRWGCMRRGVSQTDPRKKE